MTISVAGSTQGHHFQEWLRGWVRAHPEAPQFPDRQEDIPVYLAHVRSLLQTAAGPAPESDPLQAEVHQIHERDGYRIEAVSFNTFAGLRMTATAYVPESDRPVPGVLCLHGHHRHGRRNERMQRRCAALARSGYFALTVDSIGNGERAVSLPGYWHEGWGPALWSIGLSVFGIQIYENARACDYLSSRPEVDPSRLAVSGASGGGSQSLYSGAWDERFAAVVPVCSVGSYRLQTAVHNCFCETPFGLAGSLEQSDILALMAPRAVLVINARADGASFRFEAAAETVQKASRLWEMQGCADKIATAALPISHGYPPPARDLCLGWFDRWLLEKGDGAPVPEPDVRVEDYGTLACYPEASRSAVLTLPELFVRQREERRRDGERHPGRKTVEELFAAPPGGTLRQELVNGAEGPLPGSTGTRVIFRSEDGTFLTGLCLWPDSRYQAEDVLLAVGEDKDALAGGDGHPALAGLVRNALSGGRAVWLIDLPGLGEGILPGEHGYSDGYPYAGGAVDAARACHMLGFSLAGRWLAILDSLAATARQIFPGRISLAASGGPATAVLAGASLLHGFDRLVIFNPLASVLEGEPDASLRVEALIPGLLQAGDIPALAALAAPLPLTVAAPLGLDGRPLSAPRMRDVLAPLVQAYAAAGRERSLHLLEEEEAAIETGKGFILDLG